MTGGESNVKTTLHVALLMRQNSGRENIFNNKEILCLNSDNS